MPAARVAVVGEAPSARSGSSPFDGASGRRLERLGLALDRVALYNLLDYWPGPAGKGSLLPAAAAREAAAELLPRLAGHRRVVVAGRRAARALGLRERYLVWTRSPHGNWWAVLPHPSGVNHWWNDPANADAARRFLRKL